MGEDSWMRWGAAMRTALYGPAGFYTTGAGPAAHFRTSVHASPLFTAALATLLTRLHTQLGAPATLDVVDIGAGRGELLRALPSHIPVPLRDRLRLTGVDVAPRPPDLPDSITWRDQPPSRITGLLIATEWLDNVPLDIAELDVHGVPRYLHTDDTLGERLTTPDAHWLAQWWPLAPGTQAEIGRPRDEAWRTAVATIDRGLAIAIDYGHLADNRPALGTLTGYRHGRAVPPTPDGTCDLTAHVAIDALTTPTSTLLTQRAALHRLGITGQRPPLALASRDPAGYLRTLATATQAAELTDPAGLGGHHWLLEPVGTGQPVPWPHDP